MDRIALLVIKHAPSAKMQLVIALSAIVLFTWIKTPARTVWPDAFNARMAKHALHAIQTIISLFPIVLVFVSLAISNKTNNALNAPPVAAPATTQILAKSATVRRALFHLEGNVFVDLASLMRMELVPLVYGDAWPAQMRKLALSVIQILITFWATIHAFVTLISILLMMVLIAYARMDILKMLGLAWSVSWAAVLALLLMSAQAVRIRCILRIIFVFVMIVVNILTLMKLAKTVIQH